MSYDNYFGINTPEVLTEKEAIEAELARLAKSLSLYDCEGGWSDHNLEQLSHELWFAGFDASDTGALQAAIVGYDNGVGSGAGAASHFRDTGGAPNVR